MYTKIKINSNQIIKTFTFVEKISRLWKRNFLKKKELVKKFEEMMRELKI